MTCGREWHIIALMHGEDSRPQPHMAPHDALRHYFGFPEFRPGQEAALNHVLAGRDTLVVMPTGSGKSLIYQLAALLLPGTALVISPLIALMKDQIDGLNRRGIAATFINSSLDTTEQARRLRALAEGQYKIVLAAPERFRNRAFRQALGRVSLSLLGVDEAHCLSQWGHDFRPDYLHIAEARADFKAPVTLALTATATPRVQDDIIRMLGLSRAERIITGFNRPNLTLEVFSTLDVKAKLNFVRDFLASVEGAGIIYTGTRRDTEEVAEFVQAVCGIEARHYHGALDPDARTEAQDAFMAGDVPIVVATNAFGMGIDRPDVRFVLHYDMPGTLEAYYQEAGRAGRDGLPARVVLLYSPKDTALQEFFIENDSPSANDLRAVHSFLRRSPETRLDEIERVTGLPQIKARVALDQLEAAHALRRLPGGAFGLIRVETLPLAESDLQAVAAQVAARREHKYRQLEIMVDYAETNACRRRTILDHFGDTGSADAPVCCDNCLSRAESPQTESRPAQTQSERAALIVLDTLAHLKWEVGKSKLAQILKGSSAREVTRYRQARNYAKFAGLRMPEIESLIGQLIDSGYLKQVGSKLPTLKLTPKGESALKARAAIRVDLRPVQPGAAQKARAEREAGGTIALTGQMLARELTPEQIAAERGLSVSTIYSHLARLIDAGQVSIDAVVPANVQQQIRAAIETVGSAGYLAPIKALLPEEIDYGVIRCVANAWMREHSVIAPQPEPATDSPASSPTLADLPFEPLRGWRQSKATALDQPYWYLFGDGALRQLARSRPRTKSELRAIPALSADVIDQYGDEIIVAIHNWTSTRVIEAILECVRSLPGQLPRSGVAKLLVGSRSRRVERFQTHPLYDRLPGLNRSDVTMQVDALLAIGLLRQDDQGHLIPADERFTPIPSSPPAPTSTSKDRAARVHALGESRSLEAVPELVAALTDPDGNVRRLAASALGKLRAVDAVEPLLKLLEHEPGPQVRQYAIKALGRIGDKRAQAALERISRDPAEMEYNRVAASAALKSLQSSRSSAAQTNPPSNYPTNQPPSEQPDDPVAAFLARSHPRLLTGPWRAGWALDFNSRFSGADHSRSEIGELAYLYKYRGERHLAHDLAARWVELLAALPELPKPDVVIPIPPSTRRAFDPVTLLAQALAEQLGVPTIIDALVKTRATRPQKEMTALAQKQANVAGAFALKGEVRGKRLILVDDLYDSGATLAEAARVLTRGGAASLVVLTLTKTIHADA